MTTANNGQVTSDSEPIGYGVARAVICVALIFGVSAFDPPLWLGTIIVVGLMAVALGVMHVMRRRSRGPRA
jgi:hypothetical protein